MHWACCRTTDYTPEDLQRLYADLSPSRKARISRLRRDADRQRSLAAELLVYDLLKKHCGIDSARLHCKENGQPYLSGCQMYVSIAHSGDRIACAISREPVGIDIELIRPIDLNICRHVCVPEETQYLAAHRQTGLCDDPATLRRFYEIWTAKEAYFKKCGTGITDLKSVNILPMQRQLYSIEDYCVQIL